MAWQETLLYFVLLLYLAGCAALVAKWSRVGRLALVAACAASVVELLAFVYLFLADDFDVQAVFEGSSSGLPLPFKLLASWTGAGGSLLLWLGMLSVALAAYEVLSRRPSIVTSLIASLFSVYIVIALIFINPFAQIGVSLTNGLGLTPSLQSYWALIHPPTVFTAYTAMVFLFAVVVSRRWSGWGESLSGSIVRRLFVLTWVLLGLGILFGGIWAYQTEGWGGFWAWDPIETSALVPWVGLTAVLIPSGMGTRLKGNYAFFGATFSASTLLFTSYVARGSAAPSVHGYGDIVSGAPFITLSLFPIMIAACVWARKRGTSSQGGDFASGTFMLTEFVLLLLLALGNLALLLVETFAPDLGVMYLPSEPLHDWVSFPFVAGTCAVLAAEVLARGPKNRRIASSLVITFLSAVILVAAILVSHNLLFDLVLPFAVAILIAGLYAAATQARDWKGSAWLRLARCLTLVGIGILLIGVAFSTTMRTTASGDLAVGQGLTVSGYQVTITQAATARGGGTVYLPPTGSAPESVDTSVGYSVSGQGSEEVAQLQYYPALDQFIPVPSIQSSLGGDLYVVVSQTGSVISTTSAAFRNGTIGNPTSVGVNVQFIPAVSFVWLGAYVMLLGNLPLVFLRKPEQTSGPASA